MVWLCTEHQRQDGVMILSDEVADLTTTRQEAGIDVNSAFKDLTSIGSYGADKEADAAGRKAAAKEGLAQSDASGSSKTRQPGI